VCQCRLCPRSPKVRRAKYAAMRHRDSTTESTHARAARCACFFFFFLFVGWCHGCIGELHCSDSWCRYVTSPREVMSINNQLATYWLRNNETSNVSRRQQPFLDMLLPAIVSALHTAILCAMSQFPRPRDYFNYYAIVALTDDKP
jgi:hypothetical protein